MAQSKPEPLNDAAMPKRQRTGAVQNLPDSSALPKDREVLDCACPPALSDHPIKQPPAVAASLSDLAHERLLSLPHEPLFIADWDRVLMIHYQVDRAALQRVVPFELDLLDDCAYVSVVAFTMIGMRPRFGGRLLA